MANKRKFEKCFSEVRKNVPHHPDSKVPSVKMMYYDVADNALTPFRVEAYYYMGTRVGGFGAPHIRYEPKLTKVELWPHMHDAPERFFHIGLDPDHPDDLGGTVEFWLGEGEEAEGYITNKPSAILVPKGTVHLPSAIRELHRPFMMVAALQGGLWAGVNIKKVPPHFKADETATERAAGKRKYAKCITERNPKRTMVLPSHKGKVYNVLTYDMRDNLENPQFTEINLIYGAGIGWGCGDACQYPQVHLTRSVPHKHDVVEAYFFIGTDPGHPDDLGGTVEFWIGEGNEAEEYVFNKRTIVLIPPATTHLPLYIKEVHNPFLSINMLNRPLWWAHPSEKYPRGFKHDIDENDLPPEDMS